MWVHFTGICGVTTGQLAVELNNEGNFVSGSDKGFFPPISTHLENHGINIELGYKEEHLDRDHYQSKNINLPEHPDYLVYQGAKGTLNPEYIYAKKLGIPIKYYTDIVKEKILVDNSVVVAGTYGKTTISSMLSKILVDAGVPTSFMFGGISLDFKNGVKIKTADTKYSVIEGDEYYVSTEVNHSKFFEYSPKFVILTSIKWDHVDLFPTYDDYIQNFKNLIDSIPEDGVIVYNGFDIKVKKLVLNAKCKTIDYQSQKHNFEFILKVFGHYNKDNAFAAASMASYLGIDNKTINSSLSGYLGIKRRMETKYQDERILIIDDFGASPSKAHGAISALKHKYYDHLVVAIFEPNLGSRSLTGIEEYRETFLFANRLILPRFTHVKGNYMNNNDLGNFINQVKPELSLSINNDEELLNFLIEYDTNNKDKKIDYIFLGSHSFRGILDKLVDHYENKN